MLKNHMVATAKEALVYLRIKPLSKTYLEGKPTYRAKRKEWKDVTIDLLYAFCGLLTYAEVN